MPSDIQRIVETISAQVGRPALIEDRRQRVVAYSEQRSELTDEVRRQSILERHTRPPVIRWFAEAGIKSTRAPLRTPPCEELGLLPRVCVPIHHEDVLLGFVWFIDADRTMTDAEIALVTANLAELSLALYRENFLSELTSHAESSAARATLLETPEVAVRGVEQALEDGLLSADGPTYVLVADATVADGVDRHASVRTGLEDAAVATRRWIGPGQALILPRGTHVALSVTGEAQPRAVAEQLSTAVAGALDGIDCGYVIGVGTTQTSLAHASSSYREARTAAQIARLIPALAPISEWSELGVYRLLAHLDQSELDIGTIHPGLHRLLTTQADPSTLLSTLETYLDLAGNVTRTAERLRIHRATLYYRLGRIQDLANTNLNDGHERLCLHLAAKLARIGAAAPTTRR